MAASIAAPAVTESLLKIYRMVVPPLHIKKDDIGDESQKNMFHGFDNTAIMTSSDRVICRRLLMLSRTPMVRTTSGLYRHYIPANG
jgi:hypothetical protein